MIGQMSLLPVPINALSLGSDPRVKGTVVARPTSLWGSNPSVAPQAVWVRTPAEALLSPDGASSCSRGPGVLPLILEASSGEEKGLSPNTRIAREADRWRLTRQRLPEEAKQLSLVAQRIRESLWETLQEYPPTPLARVIARGEKITVRILRQGDPDRPEVSLAAGEPSPSSRDERYAYWTLDLNSGRLNLGKDLWFECEDLRSGPLTSALLSNQMQLLLAPSQSLLVRDFNAVMVRIVPDLEKTSAGYGHTEPMKLKFCLLIRDILWAIREREAVEPRVSNSTYLQIRLERGPKGWTVAYVFTPAEALGAPLEPDEIVLSLRNELWRAEIHGLQLEHNYLRTDAQGKPEGADAAFQGEFGIGGNTVIVFRSLIKQP